MGKTTATINRNDTLIGLDKGADYLSALFSAKLKTGINSSDFGVYQGSIILRALTIELVLKCLIDEAGASYSLTHDVTTLFNQLDNEMRLSISQEYKSNLDEKKDWPGLDELLIKVSAVFVEWRYATFDGKHLNIKLDAWVQLNKILIDKIPNKSK